MICCPNTTQSTTQASPQDNYHLAVVESPRSEPSSLAKSIASYIMASLSNSSTSSPVGAPSLSSYLSPRQVDNTKLHTIPVVCNNTIVISYAAADHSMYVLDWMRPPAPAEEPRPRYTPRSVRSQRCVFLELKMTVQEKTTKLVGGVD